MMPILTHDQFNQAGIEAALEHSGGTHRFEHVRDAVIRGELQYWQSGNSFVITELETYPLRRVCHMFLGGGSLDGVRDIIREIEPWALTQGCSAVTMAGRRGWLRSFLVGDGYAERWVGMAKELGNG